MRIKCGYINVFFKLTFEILKGLTIIFISIIKNNFILSYLNKNYSLKLIFNILKLNINQFF